jgi:hypothetical protein
LDVARLALDRAAGLARAPREEGGEGALLAPAAASTSERTIRPRGPLPSRRSSAMPCTREARRASGVARTRRAGAAPLLAGSLAPAAPAGLGVAPTGLGVAAGLGVTGELAVATVAAEGEPCAPGA